MVYCNKNSTLYEKLQNLSMPPMYDIVTLDFIEIKQNA